MKHSSYLLAALLMINTPKVFAQTQNLTLKQSYESAIDKYPGLAIKEAQIKYAEYQAKRIKSNRLPQTNLQIQNTYGTFESSSGAFFPLPGMFNVNGNNTSQTTTTFNAYGSLVSEWEFFSFGKLNNENKAADLKVKEAESDLSVYQLSFKSTVSRLFFNVIYNEVKLKWTERSAGRANEILTLSISLANAGLKPGADTSLASSSYLQILSDQDLWRGRFEASKFQLHEFTGLNTQEASLLSNQFLSLHPQYSSHHLSSADHPTLIKINDEIDYQGALHKSKQSSIFPSLSLLGGVSGRGSGADANIVSNKWLDGYSNGKTNYLVGLGLKWNLTGIYDTKIEQRKIEQNRNIAQLHYEQQELKLKTSIQATKVQLHEQEKQVQKTKKGVEKAEEAYNLYRTRYESGLINLTDLLQIQLLLQQAEEKHIDAFRSFWEQVIIQSETNGDFSLLFDTF
jgi:outer membrane protein TolC